MACVHFILLFLSAQLVSHLQIPPMVQAPVHPPSSATRFRPIRSLPSPITVGYTDCSLPVQGSVPSPRPPCYWRSSVRAPSLQASPLLTPTHTIKPSAHVGSTTPTWLHLCPVIQSGIWRNLEPCQFHCPLSTEAHLSCPGIPKRLSPRVFEGTGLAVTRSRCAGASGLLR